MSGPKSTSASEPPGTAYAAMPDERAAFEAWWPTVGQTIGEVTAWLAWQARASHGQAPEQADTKTHALLSTMVDLLLNFKDKIGYKPGSVIDKTVSEAVEHLKDWPYPEPAQAAPAAVAGPSEAGFVVELDDAQEARFANWHRVDELTPWQRSVARLALLLNTTKRGLIDYDAAQHFANELMTRTAAPTTQPAPQQEAQEPVALRPYNPTTEMRWAAKRIDPALTHDQIRALWSAMWSAAPPPSLASQEGALRHYGEACWKAGYKHGAWADTKPAHPALGRIAGGCGRCDQEGLA